MMPKSRVEKNCWERIKTFKSPNSSVPGTYQYRHFKPIFQQHWIISMQQNYLPAIFHGLKKTPICFKIYLQSRIDVYTSHFPDGTSIKNLLHWAQVKLCTFLAQDCSYEGATMGRACVTCNGFHQTILETKIYQSKFQINIYQINTFQRLSLEVGVSWPASSF